MLILQNFTNKVQNWTLTKFFDHLGGGEGDTGDRWSNRSKTGAELF